MILSKVKITEFYKRRKLLHTIQEYLLVSLPLTCKMKVDHLARLMKDNLCFETCEKQLHNRFISTADKLCCYQSLFRVWWLLALVLVLWTR